MMNLRNSMGTGARQCTLDLDPHDGESVADGRDDLRFLRNLPLGAYALGQRGDNRPRTAPHPDDHGVSHLLFIGGFTN